jgi:hypothetical protein
MSNSKKHPARQEFFKILGETIGAKDVPPTRTNAQIALITLATLAEVIEDVLEDEAHNDARHRVLIYTQVAEVLTAEIGITQSEAVMLTLWLIKDDDKIIYDLLMGDSPQLVLPPALEQKALSTLINILVHYDIDASRKAEVKTEVWFKRGGSPIRTTFTQKVPWHQLPSDVREQSLREGKQSFGFKLYPKKD